MDQQLPPSSPAPVRRYGEATLDGCEPPPAQACPPTAPPVTRQYPEKQINWGQVLKGVAIITGVLLVAAVAITLAAPVGGTLFTWLNGLPYVGQAVGGLLYGANWIAGYLGAAASYVGTHLFGATAASTTVAAASPFTAAQAGAAGQTTFGWLAGGATFAVAAPIAAKSISTLHIVDPVGPVPGIEQHGPHGADGALVAQSHSAANAAKLGQHAVEHGNHPRPEWMQRVNASAAYQRTLLKGGSFADAVRAAHAKVAAAVGPRNASFSQQIDADRVSLENVLKDNTR